MAKKSPGVGDIVRIGSGKQDWKVGQVAYDGATFGVYLVRDPSQFRWVSRDRLKVQEG